MTVPAENVTVIRPRFVDGLADEAAAFREARAAADRRAPAPGPGRRPRPRRGRDPRHHAADAVGAAAALAVRELAHVPAGQITIINGTGSHRANTPAELERMVGRGGRLDVPHRQPRRARPGGPRSRRAWPDGRAGLPEPAYVEADRRIVVGFIEPHFMAGFSGGYKGIFPALADIDAITHYHRAAVIADPKSTWGVLAGNPTQEQIRGTARSSRSTSASTSR